MRILIVSQYFWPESFIVNNLATELKEREHEVTVLTGLPNYPQGHFVSGYSFWRGPWVQDFNGVKILRVPLVPRKKGFLNLALNYFSFVFFGILLGPWQGSGKYDVIFSFNPSPLTSSLPAILLRWRHKVPLIIWVQDLWPESVAAVGAARSSFILNSIGIMVRYIYSKCDLILVQSLAFKESVKKWGGDPQKIKYIPNWAKLPIKKHEAPAWLNDLPAGFKIVFAGNIGKAQDMPTILSAAEKLKDSTEIQWLIVGDGSEYEYVKKEILSRGLQSFVHTFGRRSAEDMPFLYEKADLLLVSLTNEYIFSLTVPSKVQGYMACSKPILAALNGEGARVILEAGAGLAAEAENPQSLADAVTGFYQMPSLQRQKMGESGFAYFNAHFEESLVVQQIENACADIIAKYRN